MYETLLTFIRVLQEIQSPNAYVIGRDALRQIGSGERNNNRVDPCYDEESMLIVLKHGEYAYTTYKQQGITMKRGK